VLTRSSSARACARHTSKETRRAWMAWSAARIRRSSLLTEQARRIMSRAQPAGAPLSAAGPRHNPISLNLKSSAAPRA
jgi:hypothetical protein